MSKFKIILKLLAVKSCTYLSELPWTKFEGSVVQLKVPCVKRQEGFCYFDCNIFYFGHIFYFRSGWVGWTENVILMFCMTNWVWLLPQSSNSVSIHQRHLWFVVTEIFKSISQSNPEFMWSFFKQEKLS